MEGVLAMRSSLVRHLVVASATAALLLSGAGAASAGVLPVPDLRFFAPTLTHAGVNGVNGDLKVGTTPVTAADVVVQVGAAAAGPFTDVAHTSTDAQGAYTFHLSIPKTGFYRTTFAGNASAGAAVSRVIEIVVGPLPTGNSFHAPIAHAPGLTGMNGVISHGWNLAGDPVQLQKAAASTGPWTNIATSTLDAGGSYVFHVNVPATAWYRSTYAGTATSGPSVSAPKLMTVIPGLILVANFTTGNFGVGSFTSTGPVRVSVSVVCGGTIFGGRGRRSSTSSTDWSRSACCWCRTRISPPPDSSVPPARTP